LMRSDLTAPADLVARADSEAEILQTTAVDLHPDAPVRV